MSIAPVQPKVWAGTIGSGVGGVLSALILWILGVTVWGASPTADAAEAAVAAVPAPITATVALVVTVGATFLGGWLVKVVPNLPIDLTGSDVSVGLTSAPLAPSDAELDAADADVAAVDAAAQQPMDAPPQ